MARTAATVVALTKDNSITQGTLNAATTSGNYIVAGTVQTADLRKILLMVINGSTLGTLTVRACGNGSLVAGGPQTSPYPSAGVFTQGAIGDLTVTWGTTTGTTMVGPFSSDRFTQPDGNMYLDWSTATGVTWAAYQLPFNQS